MVLCPLTEFYNQYATPGIFKTKRKKNLVMNASFTGLGHAKLPSPVLLVCTYKQDAECYHTILNECFFSEAWFKAFQMYLLNNRWKVTSISSHTLLVHGYVLLSINMMKKHLFPIKFLTLIMHLNIFNSKIWSLGNASWILEAIVSLPSQCKAGWLESSKVHLKFFLNVLNLSCP